MSHVKTLPLTALLLALGPGCAVSTLSTTGTSGGLVEPSGDQRGEARLGLSEQEVEDLRGELRRRAALLKMAGDSSEVEAQRRRNRAALALLHRLDPLRGLGDPTDLEGEAIAAYADYVRAAASTEVQPDGVVDEGDQAWASQPPAEGASPGGSGELAVAQELHDTGDIEGALELGERVLSGLQDVGVDSWSLRFLLGTWAAEIEDHDLAEYWFRSVERGERSSLLLIQRATAEAEVAAAAALGPDERALAEARSLEVERDLVGADAAYSRLVDESQDEAVRATAEVERRDLRLECEQRAVEIHARCDTVLQGPGPYDFVVGLLDEVETFPEGTWDAVEQRRLRAWLQGNLRAADGEDQRAVQEELDELLRQARDLAAEDRYREAVEAYQRLDGTPLQATARSEARQTTDSLVASERERAARLFVAARKLGDAEQRRAQMLLVKEILAGLLEEFPHSVYVDKVQRNLKAVEKELEE